MKLQLYRFIAFVLWMSAAYQSLAKEVIYVSAGEYPPGYSEYSFHQGFTPHIITAAYKKVGVQVVMQFQPWKRAYQSAKDGVVEGTCCWFSSSERESDFYLSDVITDLEGFYFFHLRGRFDWKNLDDLGVFKIGVTSGYTYGDDFYQADKNGKLNLDWVTADEQNLRKLLLNRVDVTILDINTGYELIRRLFTPEQAMLFTHHPKPLRKTPTHFLLTRKKDSVVRSQRLLKLFNQGLKQLKESGEYDEIIAAVLAGKYSMQKEKWVPAP